MPSAAAKKKLEAKKAAKAAKGRGGSKKKLREEAAGEEGGAVDLDALKAGGSHGDDRFEKFKVTRTVTGVLTSRPEARDIKIDSFSMNLNGVELIQDCSIELTIGRRYGLVGLNGCGKTNFLQVLANREVPIPEHMDLYHLREEAEKSDRSALQAVVDHVKEEVSKLEKLEEHIMETSGAEDERLMAIYDRLEELDPETFEVRAGELLHGLGFDKTMMERATKDMSGGWRMRVSLARALFARPTLLLLDEPTNHLDLEACVWLEEYLKTYDKCLIIISHSQDFLNNVCTHTIWITQAKLKYYTGSYDTFVKTVAEDRVVQQKKYEKEQEDIRHIKQFIASCGTFSNLVKQAKSKQKILDKMYEAGLTPPVAKEHLWSFKFPDTEKLPPPVMPFQGVSFSYSGKKEDHLYEDVNLAIDCDSRVALVGPNGAGKSTLLKLMVGDLDPTEGTIGRHSQLNIGRYYQHSVEALIDDMSCIEFFMHKYPNTDKFQRDVDQWRAFLGRYGVSGKMQTVKIGTLSEGQKSRIVIAMICMGKPNLLLLDEPTNHLDMEAIDALADAIKAYNGGLVLVSHDFRLIDQVAEEIWLCEDKKVSTWKGDIRGYKKNLIASMKVSLPGKK